MWKSLRYIARKCNVAILGVHHDSKTGNGDGGGRGASVNRDKVQVGLGMRPLSDDDFETFGPGPTIDGAVLRRDRPRTRRRRPYSATSTS